MICVNLIKYYCNAKIKSLFPGCRRQHLLRCHRYLGVPLSSLASGVGGRACFCGVPWFPFVVVLSLGNRMVLTTLALFFTHC